MLQCVHIELRWKSPAWPPTQTLSFNRMLVGLQSTVFLILRGKKLKNMYKMQIVTQRCRLMMCLTLGMFWMISTQVLLVLNFLWSGVHLRCLITAALAANQMSGHLVRHMVHFSSTLLWRGSGSFGNSYPFSGVLMWEVFTEGRMPFEKNTNYEVVTMVTRGHRLHRPKLASKYIYEVMLRCWQEV